MPLSIVCVSFTAYLCESCCLALTGIMRYCYQAEFETYRRQKASEVAALDGRLRALLTSATAEAAERAGAEDSEDEMEEAEEGGGPQEAEREDAGEGGSGGVRRPTVWRPPGGLDLAGGAVGGRKAGAKRRAGKGKGKSSGKGAGRGTGARPPILRVPQRVVIPSDLSDTSGGSDATDALLADAARQTQRFQRIIQLRTAPPAAAAQQEEHGEVAEDSVPHPAEVGRPMRQEVPGWGC